VVRDDDMAKVSSTLDVMDEKHGQHHFVLNSIMNWKLANTGQG